MAQLQITPDERRELRAQAHHLNPVVMIGNDGLTPAVSKEADAALNAHGLIKVRVQGDDRAAREAIWHQMADELSAACVQHIGKLLVLWRPRKEKEQEPDLERLAGPRQVKVVQNSRRGGQAPSVRTLKVLGNQRLTAGGQVKRAKPRLKSIKKNQNK